MHEIVVIMQFLQDAPPMISERYLASRYLHAQKHCRTYMKHHERANLKPITDIEISQIESNAEEVVAKYGKVIESEYGWAWPEIQSKRPKFSQLEERTGLDHWRPRYLWATTYTHAPYKMPDEGLGVSES